MLWPLAAHSEGWSLIIATLVLLLLLLSVLLFLGYTVATARAVRDGAAELPAWRGGRKLLDGLRLGAILAIWAVPVTLPSVLTPGEDLPPLPGYTPHPFNWL